MKNTCYKYLDEAIVIVFLSSSPRPLPLAHSPPSSALSIYDEKKFNGIAVKKNCFAARERKKCSKSNFTQHWVREKEQEEEEEVVYTSQSLIM